MATRHTPAFALFAALLTLGLSAQRIGAREDGTKTLAKHDTVALFDGAKARKCMGRTARCPNDCGHSGTFASFTIKGYVSYVKEGEYGDPKTDRYVFLVEDNKKNLKVDKQIADVVGTLKPGDLVCLAWDHDYVTREGSSFPVRPIRKLCKVTQEEADKLLAK